MRAAKKARLGFLSRGSRVESRVEIVIAISKVVGLQEDKIRLSQRLKLIEVFIFIYSTTMEGFEVRPGVICISMLLRSRARARSNLGHAKD